MAKLSICLDHFYGCGSIYNESEYVKTDVLMIPAVIATIAAQFFLGVQNAAVDLGSGVAKSCVDKLKGLVQYGLAGNPKFESAKERNDVALLAEAITESCSKDPDSLLSRDLRRIIEQIQSHTGQDLQHISQPNIENSAVGAVAQQVSGGQNIGSVNGGVAAKSIENFHIN